MSEVKIDLESFLSTFFEEAEEHLSTFERGLLELEENPGDREVIGQIFRSAHSIKGASGTFGLTDVMTFTHALETVLDRLRAGTLAYSGDVAKVLLASVDILRALVDAARNGSAPPSRAAEVRGELERFFAPGAAVVQAATSSAAPTGPRAVKVRFAPKLEFMSRGSDPLAVLRDLASLGEITSRALDTSALPDLVELDPETFYVTFDVAMTTSASDSELREVVAFVDDLCTLELRHEEPAASPAPSEAPRPAVETANATTPTGAAHANNAAPTIRVATDKVDKLLDLVSELVIAQAMIVEATRSPSTDATTRLNDALSAMDRHTRELQERVMSIRMVPLASVFRRLPRMVRDVATSVGKKVKLVVEGEGTEIDKSMVEQLADPLTHLVRNAIDHGLESPDERRAAGKNEEGTILLRAFHQGGNVVIEVSDDGRGLNTDAIRAKAERLGLIGPEAVLTDDQIHDFVFHPGFSTAAKVSDISGRGVGMDVVKRNVEALNGSLGLTTERGRGMRVRLRLPLTLAILDGLAVRVGAQTYVVPLLSVVESFRPTRSQLRGVFGASEVIDVRGKSVPVVRLHEIVGATDAERDPTCALVCIVESNGADLALLVDDVIGQAQFVVKSLEVNFRKVDALMGATILGDGRVAMIVDVPSLARVASFSSRGVDPAARIPAAAEVR
ncbi:Signal transduction histidine kinase CheA [Labilithrix luteola]|uniref:Chemotaxis protein CheA n=1 Tax=Labilithrix luteola TaxID=1391654 RepID=A0A0K1PKI6_9BACT|nr:chemotaxis protein CheA [Labilithrix luteola]AKU94040.1 Signal transduction histidine kinase CheA [Labilithrix luteola]